ncbi:MAG TPA: hypothetical protein VMV21_08780 [Vicinamibacteria bacterium]|nr:hypothetical protein [Vicinamibacteria bacterium]
MSFRPTALRGTSLGLFAVGLLTPSSFAEEAAPHMFLRKAIGFTDAQIATVDQGQVATRQFASADKADVAAFGAVRVAVPKEAYLRQLQDVVAFKRTPSMLEIGRFSPVPTVADVAGLSLDDGDFEAARKCRPGACNLKLARTAIERMHAEIAWDKPDARVRATALMRQMVVEYLAAYMQGGTAAMATYYDKEEPLAAPAEFSKLLQASPYLIEYAPDFHAYVDQYPHGSLAGVEDVFYWAKDKTGPKATISVFHLSVWRDSEDSKRVVIASKQIYASHYIRVGLDLTALVDAQDGGFYLMDLFRGRIDPPGGMLAGVVLGKIRGSIESSLGENLASAKTKLEAR